MQTQRRLAAVAQAGNFQHALPDAPQLSFRLQPIVLRAARFSWEEAARRVHQIYRDVLAEKVAASEKGAA